MHSFFIPLVSEFSFWLSLLKHLSALIGIVLTLGTSFRGVCTCTTALRTALPPLPLRELQGWNGGTGLFCCLSTSVCLSLFLSFVLISSAICMEMRWIFSLSLLGIVFNCWHFAFCSHSLSFVNRNSVWSLPILTPSVLSDNVGYPCLVPDLKGRV